MRPELRIVDDVAEEAVGIFRRVEPRTVVLSGGATPEAFYRQLARVDYPWEEVEFFFGDERCVPEDHPESNQMMVRDALLSRVAAVSYPMDGAGCAAQGYEEVLGRRFPRGPSFDLAVYGLGPDGHTASLFPGRPELWIVDRLVVHVPEAGLAPWVPRITMTIPALSAAEMGMFLVAGREKREALRRLLAGDDIPAARLAPRRLLVVSDRAAASDAG